MEVPQKDCLYWANNFQGKKREQSVIHATELVWLEEIFLNSYNCFWKLASVKHRSNVKLKAISSSSQRRSLPRTDVSKILGYQTHESKKGHLSQTRSHELCHRITGTIKMKSTIFSLLSNFHSNFNLKHIQDYSFCVISYIWCVFTCPYLTWLLLIKAIWMWIWQLL